MELSPGLHLEAAVGSLVFKQAVCRRLGLCLHPASCLDSGVSAPVGCWANELEENFQDGACQHQPLPAPAPARGSLLPGVAAASVFVPRASLSCPHPLQETLQDLQVGLVQALTITALAWGPVEFCGHPERSLCFPSPEGLLKLNPVDLQNQMLWGLIFLVLDH